MLGLSLGATAQHSFTVKGVAPVIDNGKRVYLVYQKNGKEYIDSCKINRGAFFFKGDVDKTGFADLAFKNEKGKMAPIISLYLEKGKINVSTRDDLVNGTPVNNKWGKYLKSVNGLKRQSMHIYEEALDIWQNRFQKVIKEGGRPTKQDTLAINKASNDQEMIDNEVRDLSIRFIKEHLDDPTPSKLIREYYREFSLDDADNIIEQASPALKETAEFKKMKDYFDGIHRGAVGANYTDLTMDDPQGNKLSLSDIIGKHKLVLVDFWASWCGPCLREMPNVIKAYEKYKDKGLEIIGVSFDSKKESWVASIEKQQLKWPQMSDLKGWGCAASGTYGIYAIPASLLIDENGIIIAKDLRGDKLDKKLSELLD